MRFLLLNQFYPPDTAPTGHYLHGLAQVLAKRGHQVKVLCSRRSYDGASSFPKHENRDGVDIVRLPATGFGRQGFIGKLSDYASFYLSLGKALMFCRPRPDLILSLTTPPYIGLLGKMGARRNNARHAHWVMDLYPDVMHAHGMAKNSGFLFHTLQKLARFQLRNAKAVLILGPMMAQKVSSYLTPTGSQVSGFKSQPSALPPQVSGFPSQVSIAPGPPSDFQLSAFKFQLFSVPLWSDPSLTPWPEGKPNPLRAERGWSGTETVFLYSGNMGLGHRFSEFLEAAKHLGSTGPRWVFAGGGKRKREIESFAQFNPDARIQFLGQVPQEKLHAHLCAADVHLASLDSAWEGLIVPSKLQASFAVGRPVLFIGGRNCETAVWIRESGGGWVVDENDSKGLLAAIQQALDPEERRKRSAAAHAFAQKHFQMSTNCARIAEILEMP